MTPAKAETLNSVKPPEKYALLVPELISNYLDLAHGDNPYLADLSKKNPLLKDRYLTPERISEVIDEFFLNWQSSLEDYPPLASTLYLVDFSANIRGHEAAYHKLLSTIAQTADKHTKQTGINFHELIGIGIGFLENVCDSNNRFETTPIYNFSEVYKKVLSKKSNKADFTKGYSLGKRKIYLHAP